ncbi:MAG: efflux RND transporter periplasmic adaptor subunit [bacterium]|nr:efflux RND transporter periplasmic adaptor subunit [bacterium]
MTILHGPKLWLALLLVFGLSGCGEGNKHDEAGQSGAAATGEHGQEAVAADEHGHEEESASHEGHGSEAGEADEHGSEEGEGDDEGLVTLNAAQRESAAITIGTAMPREIVIAQELPGEVVVNADRLAHVVPRFPGIAREVRKKLGETVRAGDVLTVVEANESLAPYEVKALISGTVIEKHITLGEYVSDQQDIYVIADLSSVWVNVTVYARDLERVRVGQTVTIEAAGITGTAEGKIDYVGPVVGEATRTSIARVVLPNARGVWRPGLFVTARVQTESVEAPLVVADKAIQNVRGQTVVFVVEGDGFRAQTVTIGTTDGEWTEILSGLRPGQSVAVENSFILKSELLKNEAGHGHGH